MQYRNDAHNIRSKTLRSPKDSDSDYGCGGKIDVDSLPAQVRQGHQERKRVDNEDDGENE
jgi:hypothetical protein